MGSDQIPTHYVTYRRLILRSLQQTVSPQRSHVLHQDSFWTVQHPHLVVHIHLLPRSLHLCIPRCTPEGWSSESMPTLARKPVPDTREASDTMRPTLRRLPTGVWTCSSLMAAIWTGRCWRKVCCSKLFNNSYSRLNESKCDTPTTSEVDDCSKQNPIA